MLRGIGINPKARRYGLPDNDSLKQRIHAGELVMGVPAPLNSRNLYPMTLAARS